MNILRHVLLIGIILSLFIIITDSLAQDTTVTISGNVSYANTGLPVDSVVIIIEGEGVDSCHTDSEGRYQCDKLKVGYDYTLIPNKENNGAPVTAFDASMILRTLINSITLSQYESMAADITQDGTISAYDAALILLHVAIDNCDNAPILYEQCIGTWYFFPDSIRYESLKGKEIDQDYVGIVCGDVSGNWKQPSFSEDTVEVESSWRGRHLRLHFWMPTVDSIMIYSGQYVINFGNDIVSIREIITDFTTLLEFHMCSGKLSVAWAGTEPQMQYAGSFTIVIQISDDARPGQEISLCFESMMINETTMNVKSPDETIIMTGSRGDINWDGSTDAVDVVLAVRHTLEIESLVDDAFWRADCDGDGHIDVTDIMGIVNDILRLGNCGPYSSEFTL